MKSIPKLLPPVWLLIFLLLQTGLHFYLPLYLLPELLPRLAGLISLALGLVIIIWGATAFKRAETPLIPFETSTALVSSGPFRFTRNPMYLGMLFILTATALFFGSLAPFFVIALFFLVIRQQYVIPEEDMLEELFGDDYVSYCSRVRRWL